MVTFRLNNLTHRQQAVLSRVLDGFLKEAITSLIDSIKEKTEFNSGGLFTDLIEQNYLSQPAQKRVAEPDPSLVVVIIGKNQLTRERLARVLADRLCIATTLSSLEDLPGASLPGNRPILLVLCSHNESANTNAEIKAFREQYPDARIAVVAESHDIDDVVMAFRAGANGYLANLECNKDLIKALELVISGQTLLVSAMVPNAEVKAPAAFYESKTPHLSAREKIILAYIVAGDSNKVIARKIGVAEGTVKVHIKSILRKIRVLNRTQAAIWASRQHVN